jgi:hypothetical protein
MPVFSFTAPHITPEEEKLERDSLSPEMRQEVQNDLYGIGPEIHETDEMIAMKVHELEQAVDALPDSKKKDFLDARARAPHLVETEASPLKFLRCEKYNAVVSSSSLVRNNNGVEYVRTVCTVVKNSNVLSLFVSKLIYNIIDCCSSHGGLLENAAQALWGGSCFFTADPDGSSG